MFHLRLLHRFGKYMLPFNKRNFSLSESKRVKEIIETKEGNTTIIEARIVKDPKEHLQLKPAENGACVLCSAGIDLKHTDVLILRQFVNSKGHVIPRRITGLCGIQQKRVGTMVTMAIRSGLLKTENQTYKPRKRLGRTYYDEETIKQRYY